MPQQSSTIDCVLVASFPTIKYVCFLHSSMSSHTLGRDSCLSWQEIVAVFYVYTLSNSSSNLPKMSLVMRKPAFCICENKDADQLRGSRSLSYLNPKFQASSHLVWLYSLVCVGPGRKPEDRFSHNEAQ